MGSQLGRYARNTVMLFINLSEAYLSSFNAISENASNHDWSTRKGLR